MAWKLISGELFVLGSVEPLSLSVFPSQAVWKRAGDLLTHTVGYFTQ